MYQLKEWLKQMFVYPELTLGQADYDEYWRSKRGAAMGALSDWQLERARFVTETLKGERNLSFSDIACGEGSIVHYIGQKTDSTRLFGTEISEVAIERARAFGVEVKKLDISKLEELPHIPEADYQILFEILEHVPHSEELLRAAMAKAHKGVFFSFPNTGFFVYRLRLFFGRFPLQWKLFPGEHVRFWTKRDLHWWLKSLGYGHAKIHCYKGVPGFNRVLPSWFAAAFVVFIDKKA